MEPKEHAFVSSGKHLTEVLKPVFEKTPINYLGVSRIYPDGGKSFLISDRRVGQNLLDKKYYLNGKEEYFVNIGVKSELWDLSSVYDQNKSIRDQQKDSVDLGYGNGISLVDRSSNMIELFHFCAKGGPEKPNNFLIHHGR